MRRLLTVLLLAAAWPALAQSTAAEPAKSEVPPPPQVAPDQTGAEPEPEVRIVQKGDKRIEEYRLNGQLYMMKVTPANGVPFYLVDYHGTGQFVQEQIDPNRRIRIPQWVLMRF